MQVPLEIHYEHMLRSDALDERIRDHVDQLERRFGRIVSCRVVVRAPHKHHRKGIHYQARIHLTLPIGEIVVSREPPLNKAHEDVYVTVRDAFRTVRRHLEERARQYSGRVRAHQVCPHGHIEEIFHGLDYGNIVTAEGHDVYFHRNSVIGANFDDLKVGDEVRFSVEEGDAGPQASSVHLVGKHHLVTM